MFYLSIHYADGRVDAIYFDTKEEAELHVELNCNIFEDDIWVGGVIDGKVQAMIEWCERFYFGW